MTAAYQRYLPVAPQYAHHLRTAGMQLAGWAYSAAGLLMVACVAVGLTVGPQAPLVYMSAGLGLGAGAYVAGIGAHGQHLRKFVRTGYFDLTQAARIRRSALVQWICAVVQMLLIETCYYLGLAITTKPYTPPVFASVVLIAVPPIALGGACYVMIAVRRLFTYPGPRM